MTKKNFPVLLILFLLISFLSCGNEGGNPPSQDVQATDLPADGILIENARARPARANGVSAVYLNVLNGSSRADTLLSLSSPIAGLTEVHETYEREEGMMGMRPAETLVFPAKDAVALEPGGMHIMLMQLNKELAEGDTLELTLQLANEGEIVVSVPVQSM